MAPFSIRSSSSQSSVLLLFPLHLFCFLLEPPPPLRVLGAIPARVIASAKLSPSLPHTHLPHRHQTINDKHKNCQTQNDKYKYTHRHRAMNDKQKKFRKSMYQSNNDNQSPHTTSQRDKWTNKETKNCVFGRLKNLNSSNPSLDLFILD